MDVKCDLFKNCFDEISALNQELSSKSVSEEQYTFMYNEIEKSYQIGRSMEYERSWLEWLVANASPSKQDAERYLDRIHAIDLKETGLTTLIGARVKSKSYGEGKIVSRRDDLITVVFFDCDKRITYNWKTAIQSKSLSIIHEEKAAPVAAPLSDTVEAPSAKPSASDATKMPKNCSDSFYGYLNLIDTASDNQLRNALFSIVPVIRCDDDSLYFDTLQKIYQRVFSSLDTSKIVQDVIINGAQRYDTNTNKVFKNISQAEGGIQSIDIRSFSCLDPIFVEMLYSIKARLANSQALFCFRLKEMDKSKSELICGKIPAMDICIHQLSSDEYLSKLIEILTSSNPVTFTPEMQSALKMILQKEMRSDGWCGEQSLKYLALKIMKYAVTYDRIHHGGRAGVLDSDVLRALYTSEYGFTEETALNKLRTMTGMREVADLAEQLIASHYQDQLLRERNITSMPMSRHIVFTGASGCGKTTAARLVGAALKEAGVGGGFHECNARALCGQYLGQTKYNTMAAVESAGGGVLFLDEAYALAIGDSYGSEAISVLLTEMEDPKSSLTIIFAGYKDEMEKLLCSNPGLKSRIGYTIDFKSYTSDELFEITLSFLKGFSVSPKAKELIQNHFKSLPLSSLERPSFGLARYSRNVASKIKGAHARKHWLAGDQSTTIVAEDVNTAMSQLSEVEQHRPLGFAVR